MRLSDLPDVVFPHIAKHLPNRNLASLRSAVKHPGLRSLVKGREEYGELFGRISRLAILFCVAPRARRHDFIRAVVDQDLNYVAGARKDFEDVSYAYVLPLHRHLQTGHRVRDPSLHVQFVDSSQALVKVSLHRNGNSHVLLQLRVEGFVRPGSRRVLITADNVPADDLWKSWFVAGANEAMQLVTQSGLPRPVVYGWVPEPTRQWTSIENDDRNYPLSHWTNESWRNARRRNAGARRREFQTYLKRRRL